MIIYDTNVIANDYEVGNKKIKQVKWAGADCSNENDNYNGSNNF